MTTVTIELDMNTDVLTKRLAERSKQPRDTYLAEAIRQYCLQQLEANPQLKKEWDAEKLSR